MSIAIASASAAVRRTLADLVQLSGHAVSEDAATADLLIDDQFHPQTVATHGAAKLTLAPAGQPVTFPVRPHLLAQQLRLRLTTRKNILLSDGWYIDGVTRQLVHPHLSAIALTEKEALLLIALAESYPNPGKRDALLKEVWAYETSIETHTLETHVYRLRNKLAALAPKPCDIVTEEGAYRLVKS